MTITRKVVLLAWILVVLLAAVACADIACLRSVRRHLDERNRWHGLSHEIEGLRKYERQLFAGPSSFSPEESTSRGAFVDAIGALRSSLEEIPPAFAAVDAYSTAVERMMESRTPEQEKLESVRILGRRIQEVLKEAGLDETQLLEARRQEKNVLLFGEETGKLAQPPYIERFAQATQALKEYVSQRPDILSLVAEYESAFYELLTYRRSSIELMGEVSSAGDSLESLSSTAAALAETSSERTERFAVTVTLTTLGLAFVGTLVLAYHVFTWVARPVRSLLLGTRAVAQGNLDHKVHLRSRDEIGELARSFDDMTEHLRRSREEIEELRIAERRELRDELIQSERLAATGRLAASVAHEICNPLYGIKTAIEEIARQLPKGPDDDLAHAALAEVDRIADLVGKMQQLHLRDESRETPVDVNSVLNDILLLSGARLRKSGIKLQTQLAPGIPKILGREGQLRQVFTNLIINASEAMPKGGTLTLQTRAKSDSVVVDVRDTGHGIPPEDLESIFEPFFSRKKGRRGAGLGLSISYDIVKRHKGQIYVESEVGRGTLFTVVLPTHGGGLESEETS